MTGSAPETLDPAAPVVSAPAPFTMLGSAGVVCEGDVCEVPGSL